MPSPMMLSRKEEMDSPEKRGKYTVTVIGCEQAGIFQAILFSDAGFKVICTDTNPAKVNNIMKCRLSGFKVDVENRIRGYLRTGRLSATTEIKKAVSQGDIIAMVIRAKLDSRRKPDYSEIENTCKTVGSNLQGGAVIFNMSIAGIGVTDGMVKETLENTSGYKVGTHFGLVYAPFPSLSCATYETIKECRRVVATSDKKTLQVAAAILETLTKKAVSTTESTRTAEAAILFEIARRDSEIATANELALLCEKIGLDCLEIQELLNHNSSYLMPPLGEVNRLNDEKAYILLEDAENLNVKLRLQATAREINEETAKHAANLAKEALRNCGKTLKRSRIVLLGVSQTPNARAPAAQIVREIVDTFEARGSKLSLFDPYFSEKELTEFQHKSRKTLSENLEGADCIVLLVPHEQFKSLSLNRLKHIMKMPAAIVDLTGTFEPGKVEKEGFTYRGLGRGVWTK